MHLPWLDPLTLTYLVAASGAAMVVVAFMAERQGRQPLWVHLIASSLAVAGILVSWQTLAEDLPGLIAFAPLALPALYFVFVLAPDRVAVERLLAPFRLLARRRLRFAAVLLLLVACAGFAFVAAWTVADLPPEEDIFVLRDVRNVYLVDDDLVVTTDRDRRIEVAKSAFPDYARVKEEVLRKQAAIIDRLRLKGSVIPVVQGWQHCNCHGWVFANGQLWIEGSDVLRILEDNGYREVTSPLPGDLAVNRQQDGEVTHTGVVRVVSGALVLVESKWGRMGRFLHPHDVHPYTGDRCTFYRTARLNGHRLHGVPSDSAVPFPTAPFLEQAYPDGASRGTLGL